jgi:hypothetical protein
MFKWKEGWEYEPMITPFYTVAIAG